MKSRTKPPRTPRRRRRSLRPSRRADRLTRRGPGTLNRPCFLRDLLRPALNLVIVGFNPGAVSAARGHYYAKPGNQFYPLLAATGLTPRVLTPDEDRTLPRHGIGLVDLCPWRAGQSDILTKADIRRGRAELLAKLRRFNPRAVAFNGLTLFRHVFGRMPRIGLQPERVGRSFVFALPSTSGLVNGRWEERERAFRSLARRVLDHRSGRRAGRAAEEHCDARV